MAGAPWLQELVRLARFQQDDAAVFERVQNGKGGMRYDRVRSGGRCPCGAVVVTAGGAISASAWWRSWPARNKAMFAAKMANLKKGDVKSQLKQDDGTVPKNGDRKTVKKLKGESK